MLRHRNTEASHTCAGRIRRGHRQGKDFIKEPTSVDCPLKKNLKRLGDLTAGRKSSLTVKELCFSLSSGCLLLITPDLSSISNRFLGSWSTPGPSNL